MTHDEYLPILKKLRATKYFPLDYRMLNSLETVDRVKDKAHWPSLFIAKRGSHSPLHADNHMTRFWVMQLSGSKLWRVFPPSESLRLSPKSPKRKYYSTVYEANTMNPDFERFPELKGALCYETVLGPGELLFVPEAWTHEVFNLEDSISTSSNFVDDDNLQLHINFLKHNMKHEDEKKNRRTRWRLEIYESILTPLDPPSRGVIDVNPTWDSFWRRHFLKRAPVPQCLKEWMKDGIDRPANELGHTALHQAALLNFVDAAEYLLQQGADTELRMSVEPFFTPLELAEDERNPEIVELFKIYG
eukprot:CAMPEP_0170588852 /NCGR_PEP_ID=MMETSP0224-20130122/11051_1 /TAXON_ID=285029 /ORGANISM="Togula jolla, Strain CCCM 725" /LENGTH=302 /DNA_ID=CAMNT_0010912597 /DNA_START=487 /DNA_END=1395 /DNA_ORIENTATION=-